MVSDCRNSISVVVATHVVMSGSKDVFGPSHSLMRYIARQGYRYFFIKYDLRHGGARPSIETNQKYGSEIRVPLVLSMMSYFGDMLSTFFVIMNLGKVDLFIGVDSVNALVGLFLRFLRRVKSVVYYSVDYSPNRFGTPVLDHIYRLLDRVCVGQSNEVWNVSRRIYNLRVMQNLSVSKNVHMPNSAEFGSFKIYPPNEIKKHSLVIVANLSESLNFELLVKAMKHVKKHVPDVRLDVIGDGHAYSQFANLVKQNDLDNTIFFLGYMNHDELECELGKYAVGLAVYSEKGSWTYYADSFKVWEYLTAGLPVVLNSLPSTSEDIRNNGAGEVVPLSPEALASSMVTLLTKSARWNECRRNALLLAMKLDKNVLLDEAFKRLFSMKN